MKPMSMVCAAAMLVAPQLVSAEIYRLEVIGRVTSVSALLSGSFAVGQAASAWFLFDTSSPGSQFYPNDPTIWYYPDSPSSGNLRVNNYLATFQASSRIFVTDNENGTIDRFIFEDTDPVGISLAGLPLNNFFINFQGGVNTLSSTRIGDIPNRLAAFGAATGVLDFGVVNDGANRVQFAFDQVTLSAIPEPTPWAMMIIGFGAVGCSLRRSRRVRVSVRFASARS